ncbi:YceI family protein [uncultured Corynebacterium sp.]|uniref:YceI family protein n=1 Tax=uncultured Corynebacterium sp. TaxID=159447 RepID=UPI0025DFAAB6|nr:YceI family protein [uncultured Corynebacterium sp.]
MRKGIITLAVIGMIVGVLMAFGPLVANYFSDRGLRTADITAGGEPASVGMDGSWHVVGGAGDNVSQAGYTFDEKLPAGSKTTSGRTEDVEGDVKVKEKKLTEGKITVDVASISSDVEKRDINVRKSILHTDKFPKASFTLTEPADVSKLPDDGTTEKVRVTGDLELRGKKNPVTAELKVLRTGEHVILQGNIPFKRSDFDIQTPQFVAATIADEGTIDLLLVLEQFK